MLCECGLSHSQIVMYLPFFLWWCERIQCLCDEMKWGGVFHVIVLDQGQAWVTEPSGSETSSAGRGLLYTLLSAYHWPSPVSRLGSSPSPLLPCSNSPRPFLLKSQCWFFISYWNIPNYLPGIKNSHTLVLLFIRISLIPHFLPPYCSWIILWYFVFIYLIVWQWIDLSYQPLINF